LLLPIMFKWTWALLEFITSITKFTCWSLSLSSLLAVHSFIIIW
jgi:hypothetical protein